MISKLKCEYCNEFMIYDVEFGWDVLVCLYCGREESYVPLEKPLEMTAG